MIAGVDGKKRCERVGWRADRPTPPFLSPRREGRKYLRNERCSGIISAFYSSNHLCRQMRVSPESRFARPRSASCLGERNGNAAKCGRHRIASHIRATTIRNQCFRSEWRDVRCTTTCLPACLPACLSHICRPVPSSSSSSQFPIRWRNRDNVTQLLRVFASLFRPHFPSKL